jgi:hypothetical protein
MLAFVERLLRYVERLLPYVAACCVLLNYVETGTDGTKN